MQNGPRSNSNGWKIFLRRHRSVFVLFVLGAILAAVGSIVVFLWFVGHAQSTGLVPSVLGLWALGDVVSFLLNLIFWEALLVGIPVLIAAIAGWLWWRRLPREERMEYRFFGPRSRSSDGGSAFSLLVFIVFCIKVFIDGNWNVAIATWTFDYLVYSVVTALVWILAIFSIPIALGVIWWVSQRRRS